jgi:hypothetical protein
VLGIGVADQVDEAVVGAEAIADITPEMVGSGGGEHGRGSELPLHAHDLTGYDVQGFIPTDGLVARFPALVDVALAARVEVYSLEGSQDAFGGVDRRLVGHSPGRKSRLPRWCEGPTPGLNGPRRSVALVEFERKDAQDLAVPNVDLNRSTGGEIG